MKRFIALTLAFVLMLSLASCVKREEPDPQPEPSPAPPVEPDTPEPAPATPASGFCLTAEYGRLYFLPMDGSEATLLYDEYVTAFDRCGDIVYAAFFDNSIRRFDLAAGTETLLPKSAERYVYSISAYEGGCVCFDSTGSDAPTPICFIYREATGETEQIYGDWFNRFDVFGNILPRYLDDKIELVDLTNGNILGSISVPYNFYAFAQGDAFYASPQYGGNVLRLNEETLQFEELQNVAIEENDELIFICENGYFVKCDAYDEASDNYIYSYYYVSGNERTQLDLPDYSFILTDICDNSALIGSSNYIPLDEDSWYYEYNYYILNEDGTVTPIDLKTPYNSLFADGDFPVMDSSTARRPVTSDIYSFFCLESGAGGTKPLCSKTHEAWLNIADRVADVALLAAPTEEEQAYLDEKGVSVDMKLYGGDGLVFIGNKACGVTDLSLDDIRAIYRGDITNWSQLGGVDHEIDVFYRDDQSGSQRLFESMLWKNETVPDFASMDDMRYSPVGDMSGIVQICIRNPYAIGFSIMTYLNDVFSEEDLLTFSIDGYDATPENVASGNYKLGTRGYVVIRSDEPEGSPARRLYDWFGSPLADYILQKNGVTPLSE